MSRPPKRTPQRTVSRRRLKQSVPPVEPAVQRRAAKLATVPTPVQGEPSAALRSYVYLTLSVLGLVCVIGFLILPAVLQFGSADSYYGERINSALYVVYFCILLGYILAACFHLAAAGYGARYTVLLVANIGLLVSVFAGAAVTYVSIFRL